MTTFMLALAAKLRRAWNERKQWRREMAQQHAASAAEVRRLNQRVNPFEQAIAGNQRRPARSIRT